MKTKKSTESKIDRRSFVMRAIGAGAAGSALLGVTACEDLVRSDTKGDYALDRRDEGLFRDPQVIGGRIDLGDRHDFD